MDRQRARQVLVLRVGQHLYGLPTERVREILHMAALAYSPGQPSLLEGFLNLRGAAIPVIRLRQLFRLEHRDPQMFTPLIVLSMNGLTVALEADAAEEVLEVDEAGVRPLGEGHSANECAESVFTWNEDEVVLLSCDLLLLAKEKECLQELQTAMQERVGELGSLAG